MILWTTRLALAIALGASSLPTPAATTYTLIDLGLGVARDINAPGKVVGDAETGAWIWDGNTRTTIRFGAHYYDSPGDPPLYFTAYSANSINNAGRVVGCIVFVPRQLSTRTAYYYDGGDVATLVTPGDATGINQSGLIVGGGGSGFFFNGSAISIPAGPTPELLAVNESGAAAGTVVQNGFPVATYFGAGNYSVLNLGLLNLPAPGIAEHFESAGRSINNPGHIAGTVRLTSLLGNGLREWSFVHANGAATGLGSLGGAFTSARDINNSGTIVGSATVADGTSHAFVHVNGAIADLNAQVVGAYGWLLRSANGINEGGEIVGEGLKDGVQHAFVLRPAANVLPPVINGPPVGMSVFVDDPVNLGVTAAGTGPITYQWQKNGTDIPGATSAAYGIAKATAAHAGNYRVVVSNPFGTVTSPQVAVAVSAKGGVEPTLAVAFYAGLTITGDIGQRVQVLSADSPEGPNWQAVSTVTLTTSPFIWFDLASKLHDRRFYRAQVVP